MENKTILITGAAGYIGGTFAYEALKRGCKVIGLDNFSNSTNTYINHMKQNFADKYLPIITLQLEFTVTVFMTKWGLSELS